MKLTLEELVELAQQVEMEDSIDWGMLNIGEDEAYRTIASSVLEQFHDQSNHVLLACMTKLIVENFVLNLKLLKHE